MKERLNKIIAFTLAIVVTCCSLGLDFSTLAGETGSETEGEKQIGNEFHLDFADIGGEELNQYFTAGKVYGAGHTEDT